MLTVGELRLIVQALEHVGAASMVELRSVPGAVEVDAAIPVHPQPPEIVRPGMVTHFVERYALEREAGEVRRIKPDGSRSDPLWLEPVPPIVPPSAA
jgi:hypothetical protein